MSDDNGFDDRLVSQVRAAMRAEVADVTAPSTLTPPTLLASVRKRYTRRVATWRITFLAAPVTAAAVVAAVVVTNWGAGTSAQPVNAAYVKEQTSKALSKVEHDIVFETAVETNGGKYSEPGQRALFERWYKADRTAFRVRVTVDGTVVADQSLGPDGGAFVDYKTRTWQPYSGSSGGKADGGYVAEEIMTPEKIREDLANDVLKVVGPGGVVNGHQTVLLHRDAVGKAEVPIELWIDETSYLPVQFRYQQEGDSEPFAISWLPPTTENLALLTTPVPAGFPQRPR